MSIDAKIHTFKMTTIKSVKVAKTGVENSKKTVMLRKPQEHGINLDSSTIYPTVSRYSIQ